jgi:chemotaxis protein methyltransferase CheR
LLLSSRPSIVTSKLSTNEFETFSRLMQGSCGISFETYQSDSIERRLLHRMDELGVDTFAAYVSRIQEDRAELECVFDALMVKETYFFRQDYQLQAFSNEVIPELVRRESFGRNFSVWSAGCSSGEEAYTIAILLAESAALAGSKRQVIGTDLCISNVEAALRGEYRASSFRSVSVERLSRYIDASRKLYRVRDPLRRMCHFRKCNLLSESDVRDVGRVDVVFCRNVLIYMDEKSRLRVLRHLYERLLPGGYLLLGHAESLLTLDTPFEPVHLKGDLVYRRPENRSWPLQSKEGEGE